MLAALALAAGAAPALARGGCTSALTRAPNAADPGVTPAGAGYLLVSTRGGRMPIRASADGVRWCSTQANVFAKRPAWITRGSSFWAPQLYVGIASGRSVVVYAAVKRRNRGHRCIGIAVSGQRFYRDLGPKVCGSISYIDPSIFIDYGGTAHLVYKADPQHGVKRIVVRTIDLASFKLGPPHGILRPRGWEGRSVEAPTVVPKDGRYFLFYSGGNYRTRGYGVGVAVSRRPEGRYRRLGGNPIVGGRRRTPSGQCGVGHQDVTFTSRDGWRLYFHRGRMVGKACDVQPRHLTYRQLDWPTGGAPGIARASTNRALPGEPSVCVKHPKDASVVCVRNSGHTVDVCDRDPDGHRAYARVITQASYPGFQSPFYDSNDSQSGCANLPFASRVVSVAVCVQFEGCSAFKST